MTNEDWKRRTCLDAPLSGALLRPDSVVVARPGWYQLITPSAPRGVMNEVVLSDVSADRVDEVIDETVETYRAHGHPTKWCVGYWTRPSDLGERLERRGFSSWAVCGMGGGTGLALGASDVVVEEVVEETLDAFVATSLRGWAMPAAVAAGEHEMYRRAFRCRPRVVHLFIAKLDGDVVGTAGLVVRDDCGYLLGTQVLSAARGRGAYRSLVAARLGFLRKRGIAYAVTQARAATSAPILEHLGFETLFRSSCYLSP